MTEYERLSLACQSLMLHGLSVLVQAATYGQMSPEARQALTGSAKGFQETAARITGQVADLLDRVDGRASP
jgi:hypothetical protein